MKRRVPATRKGEPVLAAISLPPLTEHANRHTPTASYPGKPAATPNAALIPASANRAASAGGRTASPPSSTASAANAVPSSPARAENRRTQPRAVVCGTPARAAAGRTPHPPPATSARRSSGSGPPPAHDASTRPRTPAARRTTGTPGAGPPPACQQLCRHRPVAGTAIPWPRRHRLGSLPATWPNDGGEGSLTFNKDGKILARPDRARQQHRQRARPETRPRRSDSQAVNTCRTTLHREPDGELLQHSSVGVVLVVAAVLTLAVSGRGAWYNTCGAITRC